MLKISEPLAWKIIVLRDSLSGGFKDPKGLLHLPETTTLDWLGGMERTRDNKYY